MFGSKWYDSLIFNYGALSGIQRTLDLRHMFFKNLIWLDVAMPSYLQLSFQRSYRSSERWLKSENVKIPWSGQENLLVSIYGCVSHAILIPYPEISFFLL